VIIGALFVSLAPEFLREFSEWRYVLFGVLLVVTMIFRPQGIWPANAVFPWSPALAARRARRAQAAENTDGAAAGRPA